MTCPHLKHSNKRESYICRILGEGCLSRNYHTCMHARQKMMYDTEAVFILEVQYNSQEKAIRQWQRGEEEERETDRGRASGRDRQRETDGESERESQTDRERLEHRHRERQRVRKAERWGGREKKRERKSKPGTSMTATERQSLQVTQMAIYQNDRWSLVRMVPHKGTHYRPS